MDHDDLGAGETAISYTDQFVDAAIAKLDAAFGAGFAKANPDAFAAYVRACAGNLNAFMMAATAMQGVDMAAMMAPDDAAEDDIPPPPPKAKGKRGR
jgi:hypothetical protein